MTIGFALPSGLIGTVHTQFGTIGGYTQAVYSQVIAFPPGTTVTLKNLSAGTQHTLNVLSTSSFPANPSLSTTPSGGNTLGSGYASGTINGGASTSVTLSNPGTYFIGCAFHYMQNPSMRGVIEVSASATPGPQATPPPSSGGGGGGGPY
jgi:plastocyanin